MDCCMDCCMIVVWLLYGTCTQSLTSTLSHQPASPATPSIGTVQRSALFCARPLADPKAWPAQLRANGPSWQLAMHSKRAWWRRKPNDFRASARTVLWWSDISSDSVQAVSTVYFLHRLISTWKNRSCQPSFGRCKYSAYWKRSWIACIWRKRTGTQHVSTNTMHKHRPSLEYMCL